MRDASKTPSLSRIPLMRDASKTPSPFRSDVLKGVVAHVHVNIEDDVDASSTFAADLLALGAKVRKTLCADCTHLVVQNPARTIRSKYAAMLVRKANDTTAGAVPSVSKNEKSRPPPRPVSVLWVTECKNRGERVEEAPYLVDMAPLDTTSRTKKRKSMEPTKVTEANTAEDRFSSTQQLLATNPVASPAKLRSLQSTPAAEANDLSSCRTLLSPPVLNLPTGTTTHAGVVEALKATHEEAARVSEPAKGTQLVARSPNAKMKAVGLQASGKPKKRKSDPLSRASSGSAVLKEVNANENDRAAGKRRRSDPSLLPGTTGASKTPEKKCLVMTNVDDAMRDVIISTIRKLGGFKIMNRVQITTTHVVSGNTKRTMSILKAIARGCWIISPEWVYRSLESGMWQGEAEFELKEAFPSGHTSRLLFAKANDIGYENIGSARGLLAGRKVYVGRTKAPRQELQELVGFLGGRSVESLLQADVCIGLGIAQGRKADKEVLQEKWLYDCVSRYELLPRGPYILSPSKAAALAAEQSTAKEETGESDTTTDDGEDFSEGNTTTSDDGGRDGCRTPKKKGGNSKIRQKQRVAAQPPLNKPKSGPPSTLSPQF